MTDEWLSFPAAVQLVRSRVHTSTGRAEAIVRAAHTSGEIRAEPKPISLMADDGITGMDLRRMARHSKDDLLDWLDRNAPAPKIAKRSAPTKAERAIRTARTIWGMNGPPDHFQPKDIARAVNKRLEQAGETTISDKHIVRSIRSK